MGAKVVAIDGPAASGKSTVGRAVAERLGYFYFDTGLLYRAVTWKALEQGTDLGDEATLVRLAGATRLEVGPASVPDGRLADVRVDGRDVSLLVRQPRVDKYVSQVAAHPGVRAALIEAQQEVGRRRPTVMAGRDIGTVIFPDARLKVFLTASPRERARRRLAERCLPTDQASVSQATAELSTRDALDRSRTVAPLRAADDAVVIDTNDLSVDQVVERIVEWAQMRQLEPSREMAASDGS